MGEGVPEGAKRGKYGVKLVRGPFVPLPLIRRSAARTSSCYAARLRAGRALAADLSAAPAV